MDEKLTKPSIREIVSDFAEEVKRRKRKTARPSLEVIFFRNEHINKEEREVFEVPVEILRFRKDNGRISSDVLSYEKEHGPLIENSKDAQNVIRTFLFDKDPEKTKELINSIKHSGQRDAAIITADGFLINGNRRKMALEELWEETKIESFQWMKVVILPGLDDEGGPPTLKEIEQIENRYQYQSEGKSEYYNFDRALSMRRKVELGMTLEEQLKDDPNYAHLSNKEFKKKVQEYQNEFIEPLNCIDRYLEQLGRSKIYTSISTGISDREGRWQAFRDYYNHVKKKIDDEYQRMKIGIGDDETGDVEEIAFKIIRKREFKDMGKVHKIMRDLPKLLNNNEAKKELFKLLKIDFDLPEEDCFDENGREYDERKKDHIWNTKYSTLLHKHVKDAQKIVQRDIECETPITLLEAALKKLEHENMIPENVNVIDIPKAMKLTKRIKDSANSLESDFYHLQKDKKHTVARHN